MSRSLLLVSLLAPLAARVAAHGPPIFVQPAPSYPIGGVPSKVVAPDLNGDGKLDAVVWTSSPTQLAVRLGDGAGGFGALATIPAIGPIAVGDVNGDGKPDVVGADSASNALEVRLGDGLGGFAAPSAMTVMAPTSVALGDVDGDGDLDAVMSAEEAVSAGVWNMVHVALGNGLGGFGAPVSYAGPGTASNLQLVDWNHDGALDATTVDLVSAAISLTTRLNNGAGVFGAPSSFALTDPSFYVAYVSNPADFNGDGNLDFGATRFALLPGLWGNGAVVFGDGAGHFGGSSPWGPALGAVLAPTLGDVNGDGHCDLVLSRASSPGRVVVTLGDGVGGYAAGGGQYSTGDTTVSTILVDLDGNGHLDGLAINSASQDFSVLKNVIAYPAGIAPYGTGTHGCSGVHGISATSAPTVGNSSFAIATTGAPPYTLGLLVVCNAIDLAGSDWLGIGLDFHVDLVASTQMFGFNLISESNGYSVASTPIPAIPELAGEKGYAQGFWYWSTCAPTPFHLSSSRGLTITFQP